MKLSPGMKSRWRALPLCLAVGMTGAVVLLAGPLSCGKKTTGSRPAEAGSSEKRDQSFSLPLNQQVRWTYAIETSPPLNKKPAYLLKTIGFAKASSAIDGEAAAVIRDLGGLMNERLKVRVLFLGLTDRGPEKLNAEDLGLKRARAAREFLTGLGIAKDRTEMATFGAQVAGGDPSDSVAQEKDRRVEVWLIEE